MEDKEKKIKEEQKDESEKKLKKSSQLDIASVLSLVAMAFVLMLAFYGLGYYMGKDTKTCEKCVEPTCQPEKVESSTLAYDVTEEKVVNLIETIMKSGDCNDNLLAFANDYQAEIKKFVYPREEMGCGCTSGPIQNRYRITRALEKDGVMKIDLKVAFTDGKTYFKDPSKTIPFEGIDVFGENVYDDSLHAYTKANIYRFVFQLVEDHYVFVSSEPLNS